VSPGSMFVVDIGGRRIQVRCPSDGRPGASFHMKPFTVQVPAGVAQGGLFTAMVNGSPLPVRSGPGCRPGDNMIIHAPEFPGSMQAASGVNLVPQDGVMPGGGPVPLQHGGQQKSIDKADSKTSSFLAKIHGENPDLKLPNAVGLDEQDIPNEFLCPITCEVMVNPVIAMDGHTYEKESIEKWFKDNHTSPKTNEKMPNTLVIPNQAMRTQIVEYLEKLGKQCAPLARASVGSEASNDIDSGEVVN